MTMVPRTPSARLLRRGSAGTIHASAWGRASRLVSVKGQFDLERRSVAGRALDRDRSPQRVDDLFDDPQPEADAAIVAARRGPLEAAEDPLVIVLGDAQPAIADGDDRSIVAAFHADVDRFAISVFDGVGYQVRDDLIQPALVPAADDGDGGVDIQRRSDPRRLVAEAGADLIDDL